MNTDLSLIFLPPEHPSWVLKAKGEPRWMARPGRGRIGRLTQFAPPSSFFPRTVLKLFSFADRMTAFAGRCAAETVLTSETLWRECAELLDVPEERVGFCIGTANDTRKVIALDTEGRVPLVVKIAVGTAADQAIRREAAGLAFAAADSWWKDRAPQLKGIATVSGRPALVIERLSGRPLSPFNFKEMMLWRQQHAAGEKTTVAEWVGKNMPPETDEEANLFEACKTRGALELSCRTGVIHGDFSTWNVVQTKKGFVAVDWEFARTDTPDVFDLAYAYWSRAILLNRSLRGISKEAEPKLIALGALWELLRQKRCQ